ncbi:hypothetical protein, partial [Sutterella wadsworthensis]|uniref:hypothetical protein n=1 Tax=Sutterella wadsworthensis TaxID=40545 RepID=UPI003966F4DC
NQGVGSHKDEFAGKIPSIQSTLILTLIIIKKDTQASKIIAGSLTQVIIKHRPPQNDEFGNQRRRAA